MIKVLLECTLKVEVEFDDKIHHQYYTTENGDLDKSHLKFYFEENGCPGTGSTGNAIDEAIAKGEEQSTCWACALQGENKILKVWVDGKEVIL